MFLLFSYITILHPQNWVLVYQKAQTIFCVFLGLILPDLRFFGQAAVCFFVTECPLRQLAPSPLSLDIQHGCKAQEDTAKDTNRDSQGECAKEAPWEIEESILEKEAGMQLLPAVRLRRLVLH